MPSQLAVENAVRAESTRLNSIQYLRAMAALAVVVAHSLLHPMVVPDFRFVRLGSFGVLLFFVISGFIMVAVTGRGPFEPVPFLRKRIERVVPLYWLATFAVSALAIVAPALLKNTVFSVRSLVMSCLFIPFRRADGEIVPLMKLGWSLNYEMLFYVVFAAFFFLGSAGRAIMVTLVLVTLIALGLAFSSDNVLAAFYTQPLMLSFSAGMAIGVWFLHRPAGATSSHAWIFWVLAACISAWSAAGLGSYRALSFDTDLRFTLTASALVIAGLLLEGRLPVSRVGLLLGDASYALYLVHMYCVAAVVVVMERLGAWPPGLAVLLAVVLSTFTAIAVHLTVEKPIGRWLAARRTSPRQAAAETA